MVEITLGIATILGGITAIWFFYDKILLKIEKFKANPKKNNNFTKEILREIKEYLNAGDIITARNLLIGRIGYKNASSQKKLEVIILEQKYGFLDDACTHLKLAYSQQEKFSKKEQAQLALAELKINSQKNNFSFVVKNADKVISLLQISHQEKNVSSACHRTALAHAVLGDTVSSKKYINLSLSISKKYKESHLLTTAEMYMAVCQHFRKVEFGINAIEKIIDCQNKYVANPLHEKNLDLWQAHNLKSVVQCLFVEAAMKLQEGLERSGFATLVAANLLGRYARSNPTNEGYAELIGAIEPKWLKEIIKLAMLTDDSSRDNFIKKTIITTESLVSLQDKINPIDKLLDAPQWNKFRIFLTSIDQ